jgi:murein DD-endopeptidase MepM/ murein hydrolase activator NlpD
VEARIRGKLSVEGTDAQGRSRTPRVGIDLRVDEAYLAGQDARVKLDGEFAQGGLVHGVVPPESRVWFNKKRVKVSNEGDFLIGFGRHAASRAILSFELPDGPTERHIVQVRDRVFEPEEIDGLPEEMVKLDRETKRELAKSRRRIGKVRGRSTKVPYFRDGWQWPAKGKITSTYGRKRKLNGVEKGFHWGVDIAAPVGRTVVAPAPGKVVFVEEDVPLSGLLLILDHGHGLTSSFLHLSAFSVNVGDVVEAGQEIGKVGNTGRSTGPHLDWRMNLFDARIDPQLLVEHLGPPQ